MYRLLHRLPACSDRSSVYSGAAAAVGCVTASSGGPASRPATVSTLQLTLAAVSECA